MNKRILDLLNQLDETVDSISAYYSIQFYADKSGTIYQGEQELYSFDNEAELIAGLKRLLKEAKSI